MGEFLYHIRGRNWTTHTCIFWVTWCCYSPACMSRENFRLRSHDFSRCRALGMVQTINVRFRQANLRRLRCIAESPLAPHVKNLVYYLPAGHIVDTGTAELPFFRSIESDKEMNNFDYDDANTIKLDTARQLELYEYVVVNGALPRWLNA